MPDSAATLMATAKRVVLVGAVLYGSWLGMMSVHEAGHVLHARITGGKVSRVAIPLWGFSRTDVTPNPHPLFVAWGGPLWGCLLPTVILGATRVARMPDRRLPLFFAGFCLVANGAYLALGLPARAGDAGDLVRLGAPAWSLVAFGVMAIPIGFFCWHRLGPRMGLNGARVQGADRKGEDHE